MIARLTFVDANGDTHVVPAGNWKRCGRTIEGSRYVNASTLQVVAISTSDVTRVETIDTEAYEYRHYAREVWRASTLAEVGLGEDET